MGQVAARARTNHESAEEMEQASVALRAAADAMREHIRRFNT
jgi:methyl-accepting chemotaxis protein